MLRMYHLDPSLFFGGCALAEADKGGSVRKDSTFNVQLWEVNKIM